MPGTSLRICTSHEMRELDRIADQEYGIDATLLMENAGRSAAQILLERAPHAGRSTEILVFAGKGNNAGDAFVMARRLIGLERRVRIFHFFDEAGYKDATLGNFKILKRLKTKMTHIDAAGDLQAFFDSSPGPFTVVDGILGTGLKGGLEGIYYDVVELINQIGAQEVFSLDIPTGVSGDTGAVLSTSIQATHTISFGFPKLGHFLPPGAARRGSLVNVDISLPPRFRREGDKYLLMREPLTELLKKRDRYGHKNSFGHTLLVGGSPGRIGAITMAARACHKMGTGLVTVGAWEDCFEALSIKIPSETMIVPLKLSGPEYELYKRNLNTYSSVVVGPGLGLRPEGRQVVEELLGVYQGPVVVNADALNLIADYKLFDALVKRRAPTVLTPHPGEMARLLDMSKDAILHDPVGSLREAVSRTHATVLLKGAATLITSPDDVLYLNHYPNDGMATAGSGDVLAGMIGGLLGQRMEAFQATLLGVYLHSLAGDFAAKAMGHRSMTSADIIENIGNAFKDIKESPNASGPPGYAARESSRCSEEKLGELALELSRELRPGDRMLLEGPMGAGKSTLARLVLLALGVTQPPEGSPSFAIAHEYDRVDSGARTRVVHLDLYRIRSEAELEDAGIPDYLWDARAIVLCEWLSLWSGLERAVLGASEGRTLRVRLGFVPDNEALREVSISWR